MRLPFALRVLVTLVIAFAAATADALSERWVSSSPAAGRVADYAAGDDANTLLVISYGGQVYKSIDAGARFFRS